MKIRRRGARKAGAIIGAGAIVLSGQSVVFADTDDDTSDSGCVVAIDPGHNGTKIEPYDEDTGVKMTDYPNGQEDDDVMEVSTAVQENLEDAGHTAVLVKESTSDNVTYRERVDTAEKAKADVAISIHTTEGAGYNSVHWQETGQFREGATESGENKKLEFTEEETAKKSEQFAKAVIEGRKSEESGTVQDRLDFDFGGREGLWAGNIPVISLISEKTPWLYAEYGTASGGGSNGISAEQKEEYTKGLTTGLLSALDGAECGSDGATTTQASNRDDGDEESDEDSDDDSSSSRSSSGSSGGGNSRSSRDTDDDEEDTDSGNDTRGGSGSSSSSGSNDSDITQWLSYYDNMVVIGDKYADQILTEEAANIFRDNGLEDLTIADSGSEGAESMVDILTSGGQEANADVIVVAMSPDAYSQIDRDSRVHVANAVQDIANNLRPDQVLFWVKPAVNPGSGDVDILDRNGHISEMHVTLARAGAQNFTMVDSKAIAGAAGVDGEDFTPDGGLAIARSIGSTLASKSKDAGYNPYNNDDSSDGNSEGPSEDRGRSDRGSDSDSDEDDSSSRSSSSRGSSGSSGGSSRGSNREEDSDADENDSDADDEGDSRDRDSSSSSSDVELDDNMVTVKQWNEIAQCESGGDFTMNSGNGYLGGVQFLQGTWDNNGGDEFAPSPHEATPAEQIEVANRNLKASNNDWASQWPACSAAAGIQDTVAAPDGYFLDNFEAE